MVRPLKRAESNASPYGFFFFSFFIAANIVKDVISARGVSVQHTALHAEYYVSKIVVVTLLILIFVCELTYTNCKPSAFVCQFIFDILIFE